MFIDIAKTVSFARLESHRASLLAALMLCLVALASLAPETAAKAPHIWWGVSVENRRVGLPRIQDLQQTSARVRPRVRRACS